MQVKRPGPTKGRADASAGRAARAAENASVRARWLGGIRFSGFSIIMMGVLVLAVAVLAPTVAIYAEQRAQIAELRAEVTAQETEVKRLAAERERWNDETFIVTQARERLYYVRPGEVSYLVIDDRPVVASGAEVAPVSSEVTEKSKDWTRTLLTSMLAAGLSPDAAPATEPASEGTE